MEAILELFKKLGITKVAVILSSMALVILLSVILIKNYTTSNLVMLYGNLEIEDSNKIITELEKRKIPYELHGNGTQILVSENEALRIRMEMAQDGIPSKGNIVGYEIFDKTDAFNSSNFVQNVHLLRALEGELSRTISSFDVIKRARVHLVIPKRELFSKEFQAPSASVVIEVKGNNNLTKEQVSAVSHIVATAVPGLDINRINIVDTKGKSLKISDDSDGQGISAMSNTQEFKTSLELKLKNTIEELLEKYVGYGKIEAQVSADLNFDRVVTNSEVYDPNGQVARSIQTIEEKESSKEKNSNLDSSVSNNLPNLPKQSDGGDQSASTVMRTDETTNFEISKTIKNHISDTGTIKRLSIAILVDGIYKKENGELVYTPRTAEELKKLESLVKSAVGFSDERNDHIEIANLQFNTNLPVELPKETLLDWVKAELQDKLHVVIKTVSICIVVVFFLIFFIKPFIYRIFDAAAAGVQAQVDAELALAKAEIESASVKNRIELEEQLKEQEEREIRDVGKAKDKAVKTFRTVNELSEQFPRETIHILRNWLKS